MINWYAEDFDLIMRYMEPRSKLTWFPQSLGFLFVADGSIDSRSTYSIELKENETVPDNSCRLQSNRTHSLFSWKLIVRNHLAHDFVRQRTAPLQFLSTSSSWSIVPKTATGALFLLGSVDCPHHVQEPLQIYLNLDLAIISYSGCILGPCCVGSMTQVMHAFVGK